MGEEKYDYKGLAQGSFGNDETVPYIVNTGGHTMFPFVLLKTVIFIYVNSILVNLT